MLFFVDGPDSVVCWLGVLVDGHNHEVKDDGTGNSIGLADAALSSALNDEAGTLSPSPTSVKERHPHLP